MGRKKKGPDPAALLAEQQEVERLAREFYLKAFRKEHAKSAGHRTTQKDKGKVPGFDPQTQHNIDTVQLDRLIVRKQHRQAWEDPADEDLGVDIAGDTEGMAIQELLKGTQQDLHSLLFTVMTDVDGIDGRQEIEVSDEERMDIVEAVDAETEYESRRDISSLKHVVYTRASEAVGMAETMQALWARRKVGLLQELGRHLGVSRGHLTVLQQALACRYLSVNPGRTYAELLVMFLFTCDALTIDRVLGLWKGTEPPPNYTPRSPPISKLVINALRDRDLKVLTEWTCYVSTLMSTTTRLSSEKAGRTLYYSVRSLPPDELSVCKLAKPDDIFYWPCIGPCSLDMDVTVGEAVQSPTSGVFIIRGMRSGTDLTQCTPNSDLIEVIPPPVATLKVKSAPKTDPLKLELEYVGSLVCDELHDLNEASRQSLARFVRDVKEHCRSLDSETRVLQKYQAAHRKVQQYKRTLQALAQAILHAEQEHEAAEQRQAQERSRAPPGKSAGAVQKLPDPEVNLDIQKVAVMEQHVQWARAEQGMVERELRSLKGAIQAGTDELTRSDVEGAVSQDTDLRWLLKMQTENYNEMVIAYEREARKIDDVTGRMIALKPAETAKKGKKSKKKG